MPTNNDSILVFQYRDNLEQHNTLIPESWFKIVNVLLTIIFKNIMAEKGNIDKIIQAKPEADKTDNNYRKSKMTTRFPLKN